MASRSAPPAHRHSDGQPEIAQVIETMLNLPGQQVATLDRQIADFIAGDRALTEQARLLAAVPGIGPTVLTTMRNRMRAKGKAPKPSSTP